MNARPLALTLALLAAAPARAELLTDPRLALHLGPGGGGWRNGQRLSWFDEELAQGPDRLALAVEGDARFSGSFRTGARGSMLYMGAGGDGTRTSLVLGRLEALAKLRASGKMGPYVRGGLGPAVLHYRATVPGLASGSLTEWGGSLSLAVGAFTLTERDLELRVEGEAAVQAWSRSSTGPDRSACFAVTLGVGW